MKNKVPVCVSIGIDQLERIDRERDRIPRSAFIRKLIEEGLEA